MTKSHAVQILCGLCSAHAPSDCAGIVVNFNAAKCPEAGMELRVIEKEDTMLSIEIAGEDHTFMNVLKGALLETDGITAATYDVNPEQSGGQTEPILTIKTEEDVDALDALEDGTERVIEKSEGFRDAFEA